MDKRFYSRKWNLALVVLGIATAFVPLGYLTGEQWMRGALFVLGLYGAANVGDTWAEKK